MQSKTYEFHVHGMHCASCVMLIEDTLNEQKDISSVSASLARKKVTITGNLGDDHVAIANQLSEHIVSHGYRLSLEQEKAVRNWKEFTYALPLAILFIIGFILLQKTGMVNLISTNGVNYGTAFFIGVIASLSTCLAVVGGLVLSVFSSYAKAGKNWKPQLMFHIGRLGGFFVLGGVIGAIGSTVKFGLTGNALLSLIVAIIMFVLGLNLLEIFQFTKKLQPTLPKFLSRKSIAMSKATNVLSPLLLGIVTFFLPCGFTQSMQFYTLTTGSFAQGGLTMFVYALGTLPVLALLSFGSFSISQKSWKGVFYKTAGLAVISLALLNILNSLVLFGVIDPVFNF